MKKILGLDLGVSSIGWALVKEAESEYEQSSIVKLGVRVNPLSVDEMQTFVKGKSITTNAVRTEKRTMRRNLQRYKLRRASLLRLLTANGWIGTQDILSETGNRTTFETYRLRAKAAVQELSLLEFARVLLMLNKKRGYKSSRKVTNSDEGELIDGMDIAKKLYDNNWTPGQLCLQLLNENKKKLPDFYRSDLIQEFDAVWQCQQQYYPAILTAALKEEVIGKNKKQTWAILAQYFVWKEEQNIWNEALAQTELKSVEYRLSGLKRTTKGLMQKIENYQWRVQALTEKMDLERLAIVFQNINAEISNSSGYLGAISDRSKMLYFNQQTIGQYLMQLLDTNPHTSLKNRVFYRQDYLDEFEIIWEKQASFHPELTLELKQQIRDCIIFYQRRLKSQKNLISFCEFETCEKEILVNGKKQLKTIGCRVIPRSHPLFQSFKIWQTLNNVKVLDSSSKERPLFLEEMVLLAEELSVKKSLTKKEVLSLLFKNCKGYDLNYKQLSGDETGYALYSSFSQMMELEGYGPLDFTKSAKEITGQAKAIFEEKGWNTDVLSIHLTNDNRQLEGEPYFRLWHLIYSFEGDNTRTGNGKLIERLMCLCGVGKEHASILAKVTFLDDYGSLSAKAINKILPYLKEGYQYDEACLKAGYKHSASSLSKAEMAERTLKNQLALLPKNSLRNPVVEKILNQMVHVVNEVIQTYGTLDEIRVELARELKKSAKEREDLFSFVLKNSKENESISALLREKFAISHPSKNDIIRYKLYQELKDNGYKTLYSNQYIPEEKLFSKEIEIEHIIPKARAFDDSLSNKTLEYQHVNTEKGKMTAYDYVKEKYKEVKLQDYVNRCEKLFSDKKAKLKKLLMPASEIGEGFIERDLRNTQYISKKALQMLSEICNRVTATSGSITDELRRDWQLVDVMKELNLPKFEALGEVETYTDRNGRKVKRIKDWSKRNDHRHHAMDALTVAFTKDVFIQYYNHKNSVDSEEAIDHEVICSIKNKYFKGEKALAPMPLSQFRTSAKKQLEDVLISFKTKNKVVTQNINHIHSKDGVKAKIQETPRGQLHEETIYGSHKQYVTKLEAVGSAFDEEKIQTVCRKDYREALLKRLHEYQNDPKKAFTGKQALSKLPLYWDEAKQCTVPEKVKTVMKQEVYTIRKSVNKDLKIDKVVDAGIRRLLQQRLKEYDSPQAAFSNLEENPIWVNKEKGICLKRVTITGISNATALHSKRDKDGHLLLDENGYEIPVDFVNTGNNHHVAIFRRPKCDSKGNVVYELEEQIVSFYEAVARVNANCPVVNREYGCDDGWQFLFTMKQNEFFVFPNPKTGFDPNEIDLLDPDNYASISPNLYRVQKFSTKDYTFRHHLESSINDSPSLKGIAYKRITKLADLEGIVKVRVNHIGQIVEVGEY